MAALRVQAWARASVMALWAVLTSSQSNNETELGCSESWVDASAAGLGCLRLDHTERSGWQDAQSICSGLGGKLLEWDTAEQHEVVNAIVYDKFTEAGVNDWWIGATDDAQEGVWLWASSSQPLPADFPWAWGRPSQSTKANCLVLQDNYEVPPKFFGSDLDCSSYHAHICQRPLGEP